MAKYQDSWDDEIVDAFEVGLITCLRLKSTK